MQRSAALGVVVAAPGTLISGFANAAMKRGGILRLGMGGGSTTDTLDPGTHTDSVGICLERQLRSYLTEVAASGELVGELAESGKLLPEPLIGHLNFARA